MVQTNLSAPFADYGGMDVETGKIKKMGINSTFTTSHSWALDNSPRCKGTTRGERYAQHIEQSMYGVYLNFLYKVKISANLPSLTSLNR